MGEVKLVHFGPAETWKTKEEVADQEKRSQAYWDGIDEENRQAVLLIVREALLQMIDDPGSWVPTSVEPVSDTRLDIYIGLHLAEIDSEVVRRKLEAEKALHDATAGVMEIEADLRVRD